MTTRAEVSEFTGRLAELVEQVQAGHEVLLTQEHKPIARIVLMSAQEGSTGKPLQINSLPGHRVITPVISQADLADEMLGG